MAVLLLAWQVVLTGGYLLALVVCPIWFLMSLAEVVTERPGRRITLVKLAIPAMTLGLILGNNALQWQVAEGNAERIIGACEQFHSANGRYPERLKQLVPRYLSSVPRAKYCIMWSEYLYLPPHGGSGPKLIWYRVAGVGRETYDFDRQVWYYKD